MEWGRAARQSQILAIRSAIAIQTNLRSHSQRKSIFLHQFYVISIRCFWRQYRLILKRRQLAAALIISDKTSACTVIIESWFRGEIIRWRFLEFRRLVVLYKLICRETNSFTNTL